MSDSPALDNSIPTTPDLEAQPKRTGRLSAFAIASLSLSGLATLLDVLTITGLVVSLSALLGALVAGIVGIVTGHTALREIKRKEASGRGLALLGTIFGYVSAITVVVLFVLGVALVILISAAFSQG